MAVISGTMCKCCINLPSPLGVDVLSTDSSVVMMMSVVAIVVGVVMMMSVVAIVVGVFMLISVVAIVVGVVDSPEENRLRN